MSRRNSPTNGITGLLIIDKPRGMTSMDVIRVVRRGAGGAKTGHAGTLDPLATGVLVVALGKATRWIDRLMATSKRYESIIDLTAFTTTDDLEGERTEIAVPDPPSRKQIEKILKDQFTGNIMQKPPAFSAIKIKGRRAYDLARKGVETQIPPRPAIVHSIGVFDYEWPLLTLAVHCAKGFYIRALARALGEALHTGGHCTQIRRTAVGPFTLTHATPVDDLPETITTDLLIDLDKAEQLLAG